MTRTRGILIGAVLVAAGVALGATPLHFLQNYSEDSAPLAARIQAVETKQQQLQDEVREMRRLLGDLQRVTGTSAPTSRSASIPPEPVSVAHSHTRGHASAKVVFIEYSDFQCPYCRQFATTTLPLIVSDYVSTGRVRHVFRHMPLERIHPVAMNAAAAANCAAQQNRFWEMHHRMFLDQAPLTAGAIDYHAQALGLDAAAFRACLSGPRVHELRQGIDDARELGVTSTPTFFIGLSEGGGRVRIVRRISGAQPFSVFKKVFDELLQQ